MVIDAERLEEFKQDYVTRLMSQRDMASKYGMSLYAVAKLLKGIGLKSPRGSNHRSLVTEEMRSEIERLYPGHTCREIIDKVSEKYGIAVSRKTIANMAYNNGWHKTDSVIQRQRKENAKIAIDGRIRNMATSVVKQSQTLRANLAKDRRRMLFGLECKMKFHQVLNPEHSRIKNGVRHRLVGQNNYFCEKGSDTIYYDEQTRRSLWMEQKYSRLFTFLPADGFDESMSVWTKHRKYVG